VELAPGDADDAVAGGDGPAVPGAVVLERGSGVVGRAAIELEDEVRVGPVAVGLDPAAVAEPDLAVRVRSWQRVGVEEGEEPVLELLLRDVASDGAGCEQALDDGRSRASRVARDEGSREVGLVSRRTSASLAARSSSCGVRMAARSSSVRAGVVTGMPSSTVSSSGGSLARRTCTPAQPRRLPATVISTARHSLRQIAHRAPADRRLSALSGAVSTAAIHRASRVIARWPTA